MNRSADIQSRITELEHLLKGRGLTEYEQDEILAELDDLSYQLEVDIQTSLKKIKGSKTNKGE